MSKLLPCPFCGGEARMWPSQTKADQDGSYEIIGCSNIECPIEPTTDEYLPYEEAIQRWNTRPTPARCDELVTVAHRAKYISELEHQWRHYRSADSGFDPTKYEEQPLVTRQNAEEVIESLKNEAAEKDKLIQSLIDFDSEEVKRLEADNKRLREALEIIDDHALRCAKLVKSDPCARAYVKNILDEVRAALAEVKT